MMCAMRLDGWYSMKRCWILVGFLWMCMTSGLLGQETPAGETAPTAVQPEPAAVDAAKVTTEVIQSNILRPPSNDKELADRIDAITKRLEALQQAVAGTQPSSAPATAPAPETQIDGKPVSRIEILTLHLNELLDWQKTRERIGELGKEDSIRSLSVAIADYQKRTKEYQEKQVPRFQFMIDIERRTVEQELSRSRTELDNLRNDQAQRETQLTNLPTRKTKLEQTANESLERLNVYLQDLPNRLNEVASDTERQELLIRKEILERSHNLDLLRIAAHADRRTLLELQKQQDADRMAALVPLVAALDSYRVRLESHQAHAAVKKARAELEKPELKPYQRAYWQLFLDANEGIVKSQKLAEDMFNRFPESDLIQLRSRVQSNSEYLKRFLDSLERRQGAKILDDYGKARESIEYYTFLLGDLQRKLDRSYEEQRDAMEQRERTEDAIENGKAALDAEIATLTGDDLIDARKKQMELTRESFSTVKEELSAVETNQDELIARLTEATTLITRHLTELDQFRGRLHWSYLAIAEDNLFQRDYRLMLEELKQVGAGEGPAYSRWSSRWTLIRQNLGGYASSRISTRDCWPFWPHGWADGRGGECGRSVPNLSRGRSARRSPRRSFRSWPESIHRKSRTKRQTRASAPTTSCCGSSANRRPGSFRWASYWPPSRSSVWPGRRCR